MDEDEKEYRLLFFRDLEFIKNYIQSCDSVDSDIREYHCQYINDMLSSLNDDIDYEII